MIEWYSDDTLKEKVQSGELSWSDRIPVGANQDLRPLVNVAARHGFLRTLDELSKTSKDLNQFFPLFIAVKNKQLFAADILIQNGADINLPVYYNGSAYTNMLFFFSGSHSEVLGMSDDELVRTIVYLLSNGADWRAKDSYGIPWTKFFFMQNGGTLYRRVFGKALSDEEEEAFVLNLGNEKLQKSFKDDLGYSHSLV